MAALIANGIAYTKTPADMGHVVSVTLQVRDFLANGGLGPLNLNIIAHPDGYNVNAALSNSPLNQFGYLGASAVLDLSVKMRDQGMEMLQSVYIDNSAGAGTLILRPRSSGATIAVAPFTQGVYPLLLPLGSNFSFDVTYIDAISDQLASSPSAYKYPDDAAAGLGQGGQFLARSVESGALRMQFTDVVMSPTSWSTRNNATALYGDLSSTVAVANTFQTALAANPFRKGFIVQNPVGALTPLFVWFGPSTAFIAKSVSLAPGAIYQERGAPVFVGAISVTSATAAAAYIVKEMF